MGIQFCIMRVSQSPMRALSTLHMRKYLRALPDCWANMSLISYTVPRLDLIHKVLAICPIEMPTINLDVCAKDAVKLLRMRRLAANRHDCSLCALCDCLRGRLMQIIQLIFQTVTQIDKKLFFL